MRDQSSKNARPAQVTVGFAAGRSGRGVVYASVNGSQRQLLRATFAVRRSCTDREPSYAALATVVRMLLERGFSHLEISIDDALLIDELQHRREVPRALGLAYIQLGCLLNRLATVKFAPPSGEQLSQRARSEVEAPAAA